MRGALIHSMQVQQYAECSDISAREQKEQQDRGEAQAGPVSAMRPVRALIYLQGQASQLLKTKGTQQVTLPASEFFLNPH